LLLLAAVCAGAGDGAEPERFFKLGRKAEKQGRYVDALAWYERARGAAPGEPRYTEAAGRVRKPASQTLAAAGKYEAALALDPVNQYLRDQVRGALPPLEEKFPFHPRPDPPDLKPPIDLAPLPKTADFDLQGKVRELYEQVAAQFGLEVIFDPDFQGGEQVRFELDEAGFDEAILALNDVAMAFVVPVRPGLFLVAEDTQQKRNELAPMSTATIPIPDAMSNEQLQQIADSVRQVLELNRLQIDTRGSKVVVRDTVSRVRMAQALLDHFAHARAEVLIEVDVISVDDLSEVNAGVTLPTSFPIENFSTILQNAPAEPGEVPLLGIGGGETVFGVAIGDAVLTATRLKSAGQTLQSFSLRAMDGTEGELLIGERFPIINARFGAAVINDDIRDQTRQGTLREAFPSFTFEDLGLTFRLTPRVHTAREMTLEIETEIQQLTGQMVNEIPVLSNRSLSSVVRLTEGQAALITGMQSLERRRTHSGLAFLSQIPWLGKLFRDNFVQLDRNDLIIVLTPRLVRLPPGEMSPSIALRYGPEQRPIPAL